MRSPCKLDFVPPLIIGPSRLRHANSRAESCQVGSCAAAARAFMASRCRSARSPIRRRSAYLRGNVVRRHQQAGALRHRVGDCAPRGGHDRQPVRDRSPALRSLFMSPHPERDHISLTHIYRVCQSTVFARIPSSSPERRRIRGGAKEKQARLAPVDREVCHHDQVWFWTDAHPRVGFRRSPWGCLFPSGR